MKKIILASTSLRRQEILGSTGLKFEVVASGYEEDNTLPLPPAELVAHLARGKAEWVAQRHPRALVIGADTLVALDGMVMGKPHDAQELYDMMARLNGRSHSVFTGIALIEGGHVVTDCVEAKVFFRQLSEPELRRYAQLTDGLDKAGGYGVQSTAAMFIERIEGDYLGIMGLPLSWLAVRLKEFDVDLLT